MGELKEYMEKWEREKRKEIEQQVAQIWPTLSELTKRDPNALRRALDESEAQTLEKRLREYESLPTEVGSLLREFAEKIAWATAEKVNQNWLDWLEGFCVRRVGIEKWTDASLQSLKDDIISELKQKYPRGNGNGRNT